VEEDTDYSSKDTPNFTAHVLLENITSEDTIENTMEEDITKNIT
jgi:hypothetical protein